MGRARARTHVHLALGPGHCSWLLPLSEAHAAKAGENLAESLGLRHCGAGVAWVSETPEGPAKGSHETRGGLPPIPPSTIQHPPL